MDLTEMVYLFVNSVEVLGFFNRELLYYIASGNCIKSSPTNEIHTCIIPVNGAFRKETVTEETQLVCQSEPSEYQTFWYFTS
jgi:hypothetical protein